MELSNSIRDLLLLFIKNEFIVKSWGITNAKFYSDHITFIVSALKYQGEITIAVIDANNYNIVLIDNNYMLEHIQLENVIDKIDMEIEYSDNYNRQVLDWMEQYR